MNRIDKSIGNIVDLELKYFKTIIVEVSSKKLTAFGSHS